MSSFHPIDASSGRDPRGDVTLSKLGSPYRRNATAAMLTSIYWDPLSGLKGRPSQAVVAHFATGSEFSMCIESRTNVPLNIYICTVNSAHIMHLSVQVVGFTLRYVARLDQHCEEAGNGWRSFRYPSSVAGGFWIIQMIDAGTTCRWWIRRGVGQPRHWWLRRRSQEREVVRQAVQQEGKKARLE